VNIVEKIFVNINSPSIKLDQFLKWGSIVSSGSEAKFLIAAGKVLVNEEIEKRRGRRLIPGDRILFDNQEYQVVLEKDQGQG
jgi:ribosome-associated protein